MTPADLERRRPVWSALAELYLDTEVRWYFPRIAAAMVASELRRDELDAIFRYEVTPVCYGNLRVVRAALWDRLSRCYTVERLADAPIFESIRAHLSAHSTTSAELENARADQLDPLYLRAGARTLDAAAVQANWAPVMALVGKR